LAVVNVADTELVLEVASTDRLVFDFVFYVVNLFNFWRKFCRAVWQCDLSSR